MTSWKIQVKQRAYNSPQQFNSMRKSLEKERKYNICFVESLGFNNGMLSVSSDAHSARLLLSNIIVTTSVPSTWMGSRIWSEWPFGSFTCRVSTWGSSWQGSTANISVKVFWGKIWHELERRLRNLDSPAHNVVYSVKVTGRTCTLPPVAWEACGLVERSLHPKVPSQAVSGR